MVQDWSVEPEILDALENAVPGILESQRIDGQFGDEPWICRDQHHIMSLAAGWQLEGGAFFEDQTVFEAIVKGGDALINAQDARGMWTFRKKDHSTWGQIYMPWTYSRWIRTYRIVKDKMSTSARRRWDAALTLGFEGIADQELERIHNIPAHHAMALYFAGEVFEREEWCNRAAAFLHDVAEAQSDHGWWTEHVGPVVAYNYVYVDALGVYYSISGDEFVLDALDKAARFHANYTYPDGSMVETVDERNPYHAGIHLGNPGFSLTPIGRGYLAQQHGLYIESGQSFDDDYAANMVLYAASGAKEETAAAREHHSYRMDEDALVTRHKPWFISLSAYTCIPADTRWRQDRQNFVSVYHDIAGLIIGGGNTKLQPMWSTCIVGDTSLLFHTEGDEDPNFEPRPGLAHVPESATPGPDANWPSLALDFGSATFNISCVPESSSQMSIECRASLQTDQSVEGHLTLMPHVGSEISCSFLENSLLTESPIDVTVGKKGGWINHWRWRLDLPAYARVNWPVLPHNPYRKQGDATLEEARIVVSLPFSKTRTSFELCLSVHGHTGADRDAGGASS